MYKKKTQLSEPKKESTLRGSKEGFVENIRTNTSMVRRRIIHPNLKMESVTIGKYTQSEVALLYMQGLADEKVLSEVREKLNNSLLEGKVALLTNGTPFALIMPITFWSGLQSADDYFERFIFVILLRMIRYIMTFISVYIAIPLVLWMIGSIRQRRKASGFN